MIDCKALVLLPKQTWHQHFELDAHLAVDVQLAPRLGVESELFGGDGELSRPVL